MLLTFKILDVQKIHNSSLSAVNVTPPIWRQAATVFVQLNLLLQHQPFRKDGIRNCHTYVTLRSLTLLSLIYAEVFHEVSSVEVLRPKCWIEFLILCIRFYMPSLFHPLCCNESNYIR